MEQMSITTVLAVLTAILLQTACLDTSNCNVKLPSGEVVDLSNLAREHVVDNLILHSWNSDYFASAPTDSQFYLNVCHPVNDDLCKPGSSGCLTNRMNEGDPKSWKSLGSLSSTNLEVVDGKVMLKMKNGDSCPQSPERSLSASIEFECVPGATNATRSIREQLGDPVFVSEDNCEYKFKWPTSHACTLLQSTPQPGSKSQPVVATDCMYQSPTHLFDLSALRKTIEGQNWEVHPTIASSDDIYLINICQPLVSSSLNRCLPETHVCGVQKDVEKPSRMLGKQGLLGMISDQLTLTFRDGEQCQDGIPRITEIRFSCGKDLGQPILTEGEKACGRTTFSWETSAACNLRSSGTSTGMIVFWVLFSLILAYFIFGSLYRKCIEGYDGLDVIPHLELFERAWHVVMVMGGKAVDAVIAGVDWVGEKIRNRRGYSSIRI